MQMLPQLDQESHIVWWIKRDMRLRDNLALSAALKVSHHVLPVFIIEPEIISASDYSPMHWFAQRTALMELRAKCQAHGTDVLVLKGEAKNALTQLHKQWHIDAIFAHQETGNALTFQRDLRVIEWCHQQGVTFREFYQNGVIRCLQNRADRQAMIRERVLLREPLPAAKLVAFQWTTELKELNHQNLPTATELFTSTEYESIQFERLQHVAESAAQECLQSFLYQRGSGYSGGISSPNTAFQNGSRLSPHLAWGTLSLTQVFHATAHRLQALKSSNQPYNKRWQRSLKAFRSRLHWHCHFIQRLETEPTMEYQPLNLAYTAIRYENRSEFFLAWQQGLTGFPLVDACMRCLNSIGFLNFRMRAFVVSFAVFGLHLDWRLIHPYLARVFYDYEPGIHLSQLQMQTGIVGINTVRVYSPTKQLIDQDPQCEFVKKWLPELRSQTIENIQSFASIPLDNYPEPIIGFNQRAQQMKEQIFQVRRSERGQKISQQVLAKHGSRRSQQSKQRHSVTKHPQLTLF